MLNNKGVSVVGGVVIDTSMYPYKVTEIAVNVVAVDFIDASVST